MSKEDSIFLKYNIVPSELACMLKKAGFDWPCNSRFKNGTLEKDLPEQNYNLGNNDICSAPYLWYVQKWLREEKEFVITIDFEAIDDSDMVYTYTINQYIPDGFNRCKDVWDFWRKKYSLCGCGSSYSGGFDTYEEALYAGILYATDLIIKN